MVHVYWYLELRSLGICLTLLCNNIKSYTATVRYILNVMYLLKLSSNRDKWQQKDLPGQYTMFQQVYLTFPDDLIPFQILKYTIRKTAARDSTSCHLGAPRFSNP